jgi:prepilin-type N-terminal cleavage/methylation domain-containing protein
MAIKKHRCDNNNVKPNIDKKSILGFTLIEIMLVILVVALLTLYAVRIINESIINSQVSRTASQINNIKQAIIAFYDANTLNWPPALTDITTAVPASQYSNSSAIPQLLPTTALCSPFTTATSTPLCGDNAQYQGTFNNAQGFYTLSIQTTSDAIAQALIAAIPNSWISNTTTVNVAIPLPAQVSGGNNHGWIVSAGVISSYPAQGSNSNWTPGVVGTQIYLPNCGPGYEGHIIFSPERYETNAAGPDWGIHLAQVTSKGGNTDSTSITSNAQQSIVYNTNTKDNHGHIAYATTYADSPDANTSSVQHLAFYMTFCLPIGHWGTHWVNGAWLQDAQCSTSWQTYLKNQGNPDPNCYSTDGGSWAIQGPVNKSGTNAPVGSPNAY